VQRELISTALTLSAVLSGLVCSLVCGIWAKTVLGDEQPQWWQSVVASFIIGFGSVSLVSVTVESGTNALFVCYAEDPSPLATIQPPLYSLFIQHPHVGLSAVADAAAAAGAPDDVTSGEYVLREVEPAAEEDESPGPLPAKPVAAGSGGGHSGSESLKDPMAASLGI